MKLNIFERFFITHPIRPFLQKRFEAKRLLQMGGKSPGAHVLEIGCGAGAGIDLIYRDFEAATVDAFDLDPRMVTLTHGRQRRRSRNTRLWVGNVRHIPVADETYDAVFNFGIIHHVVRWRDALREIHRVMKSGGRFYCEEILARWITHPLIGRLMDHPQADRFDRQNFLDAALESGFRIKAHNQLADLYLWVIAEKI